MAFNKIKNIAVWGDSLLKGIVYDETDGKYRPLKKCSVNLFSKLFSIPVKNNSRFGCTAPKALESLKRSLEQGLEVDAVLLEFGGNDCDYNWVEVSQAPEAEHSPHTPLQDFIATMEKMADLLQKKGIRPFFMNLPPIDAQRYFTWISHLPGVDGERVLRWLGQKDMIYRQQERYSRAIDRMAYSIGVPLIDVRDRFLREHHYQDYLCIDGIHLNERGQAVLGEVFSSYAVQFS